MKGNGYTKNRKAVTHLISRPLKLLTLHARRAAYTHKRRTQLICRLQRALDLGLHRMIWVDRHGHLVKLESARALPFQNTFRCFGSSRARYKTLAVRAVGYPA